MKNKIAGCWIKTYMISYIFTFILIIGIFFLLKGNVIQKDYVKHAVKVIYMVVCMSGAMYLGWRVKKKRLLCGLLFGAGYCVFLNLASFFMTGFSRNINGVIAEMTICLIGGILGSFFSP